MNLSWMQIFSPPSQCELCDRLILNRGDGNQVTLVLN